ncbi:dienelactone hydrolase family protein [Janibacter cremeus]|uniref:Carboxymethylenebutenolidase n=1 Tax=Janibacter cremeus TaxID=1285192 RepID=A0A852VNA0_9MICO|nr:dienelactone hydrolase family protein [Janibacter cremeus]NYF96930.1 carboxymethylenebutenolidase [Janibacter cremeus]
MTTATPDERSTTAVEGGELPVELFLPAAGSGPGIVLFQEIFGVTGYIRSRARDLADLGYVVLVPESYWRLGSPVISEGMDGLEEAMGASNRLDWDQTVADAVAATRHLTQRSEVTGATGLVGFCFGGGLAWATAAVLADEGEAPAALVAYYGSQIPTLLDLAERVRSPQLHHWGNSDQFIPAEGVAAVEDAVTAAEDATFCRYDGAGHAFDNPSPAFHHAEASALAWPVTTDWLATHLAGTAGAS